MTRGVVSPTATETYSYDALSNRLLSTVAVSGGFPVQSRTLGHGDSGNRNADAAAGAVANAAYAMTYDATDRLASVSNGAVTLGEYIHNAMGQRVSKTVGGVATTHYLYDLSGRLIAEADGATGVTASEYIAFEGINLAFITTTGIYWVHGDHLGSPQVLTDATRAVAWSALYSPFGLVEETGPLAFNPRFPGQYHDHETGYYYNYFRTYDPTSGRYVESDPIGLRGGWNTYGYVGGNPVVRVDPMGLKARVCCKRIQFIGWITQVKHCYIERIWNGITTTFGLFGNTRTPWSTTGEVTIGTGEKPYFDRGGRCGKWSNECGVDDCVQRAVNLYSGKTDYRFVRGPNSNTFAKFVSNACGLKKPRFTLAPGWKAAPPAGPANSVGPV